MRRPSLGPGLLAALSYVGMLAAGTAVLSILCSAIRSPFASASDPLGWILGGQVGGIELGIGLFLSVTPSANHTFQWVDGRFGMWSWAMWPMYWTMIAVALAGLAIAYAQNWAFDPTFAAGGLTLGSLLAVPGFPKRPKPGEAISSDA